VVYGGTRYTFVEYKGHNQAEIELNDATNKSHRIESSMENSLAAAPAARLIENQVGYGSADWTDASLGLSVNCPCVGFAKKTLPAFRPVVFPLEDSVAACRP
jgi:hypothetical protein